MQMRFPLEAPARRSLLSDRSLAEPIDEAPTVAHLDLTGADVLVFSLVADLDHIEHDALVASASAWARPTRFVPSGLSRIDEVTP
jgi:hypothetical protein